MKQPLIILAGPTASGKTALSVRLAQALEAEIISADSMQVYRRMDIGTAKVTKEEMQGVEHHLIDVIEPTEEWNVCRFTTEAGEEIQKIAERGHLPMIVGGTGFYIHALAYGADFSKEEDGTKLRTELSKLSEKELHLRLQTLDPESAASIHPNNKKRVIRALEYCLHTGEKFSTMNARLKQKESPYQLCYLVLELPREELYQRIDKRVDRMMEEGLLDEVRKLQEEGLHKDMVSMKGLGYKEILSYLNGEMSLDEAVYVLKRDTRHFAKRQMTWMRAEKEAIMLERHPEETLEERALAVIRQKLGVSGV